MSPSLENEDEFKYDCAFFTACCCETVIAGVEGVALADLLALAELLGVEEEDGLAELLVALVLLLLVATPAKTIATNTTIGKMTRLSLNQGVP